MRGRRDAIHDRVIKRGRARRLQRRLVVAVAIVVAVGLPVAAVGLNARDKGVRQVQAVAPRDEITPTTLAEPSTTASSTTSAPTTSTTIEVPTTPSVPDLTTTTSACRNSTDPACGPFYYDPPITNEPATMDVSIEPVAPAVGQGVAFTLHVTDPDSFVSPGFCGFVHFGDDTSTGCMASCGGVGPRYGPWTPPPPRPGDGTFVLHHRYSKAGTFTATFSTDAGGCSERWSKVETSVTVHVSS